MSAALNPRPRAIAFLSDCADMVPLASVFKRLYPTLEVRWGDDLGRREDIEVAVCWFPPAGELASLPNLRCIQSVGAGIEHILADPQLPDALPLFRILDPHMAAGMSAYVSWAVIHRQRDLPAFLEAQAQAHWREPQVTPPQLHRVGIAGYGTLGQACARVLVALGYQVRGWSRSAKDDPVPGVEQFVGADRLDDFLAGCQTLVCLLPLTEQTRGFLGRDTFARLPQGAHVINVGRGDHLVEADLLQALDSGHLGAATLDAFSVEPLPADSPLWRHPRISITPHIATRTSFATIATQTLENFAQVVAGSPPSARQVSAQRGY
ncbi:glyoxylate/hydroxypyruvate reductase A [Pseudomonas sp. Teo4]|uniref:2-hydroxyacid dehydrogenase n=1 Tax=Pseudomonas sp. Teo4 TaxID=3064528 RepID=UPI002ABCF0B1|nr:glyoxylate/hydroxypyruvate reductase A [Pseudomonas sp. Teo4]MDZ3992414.1 Glyoxylate/hydroxypyruvate reductase A [Pseudomonas sp. Teo4]